MTIQSDASTDGCSGDKIQYRSSQPRTKMAYLLLNPLKTHVSQKGGGEDTDLTKTTFM